MRNDRQNVYPIYPKGRRPRANLHSALNISGYSDNKSVNKQELIHDISVAVGRGYAIETPISNVISEKVDLQSVLQVIDAMVAWAVNNYPELFTIDLANENTFLYPMQLKAYFVVVFLNRMRQVNSLNQGDSTGQIPFIADEAPLPRPLFEMLAACAPYKEGDLQGLLSMDYDFEFQISDLVIQSQVYSETELSTPALLTAQGLPSQLKGILSLQKDPTTKELVAVETLPITPVSLNYFWEEQDEAAIFLLVKQIWPNSMSYDRLPLTSVSADFYACSRAAADGPANQLMCPFSNYDPYHASVFNFFRTCMIQATMNQKQTFQAPTRPNQSGIAAQYPKAFIVGVYVLAGSRLNDRQEASYLGHRKYYSRGGKSYNPSVTFKLITPAMIKEQITSLMASFQVAAKDAKTALDNDPPDSVFNMTGLRLYREGVMALQAAVMRRVQDYTLAFMTKCAFTAYLRGSDDARVSGALRLLLAQLGCVFHGENLVLPFFEFGTLSTSTPGECFFNMNLDVTQALTAPLLHANNLYVDTTKYPTLTPNDDEFQIHWEDQIMNSAWTSAYEALPGARPVPGLIVTCRNVYELFLNDYAPAVGTWEIQNDRGMGGLSMLTYTKASYDDGNRKLLPVFDDPGNQTDQMIVETPTIATQALFFCDFAFGITMSQALLALHSLDIVNSDDPGDLSEFPYTVLVNQNPFAQQPYDLFNQAVANSNGVIQKSLANYNSTEHDQKKSETLLGVPIIEKADQDLCFANAIMNTVESIGSSFLKGIEVVAETGNPLQGIAAGVTNLVDGIFSSRSSYQGSPNEKVPHPLSSIHRKNNTVIAQSRSVPNQAKMVKANAVKISSNAKKPVKKVTPAKKTQKKPSSSVQPKSSPSKSTSNLKKKRQLPQKKPTIAKVAEAPASRPSARGVKLQSFAKKKKYVPVIVNIGRSKSVKPVTTPTPVSSSPLSRTPTGKRSFL